MHFRNFMPILAFVCLAGCATDWPRNVYEGVRQHQQVVRDPATAQPASPQPDYEQYKREQEALKNGRREP